MGMRILQQNTAIEYNVGKLCMMLISLVFAMAEDSTWCLALQVTVSQGGATDEYRSWAVRGEPREVALREPAAGIPAAVSINVAGRSICIVDVRRCL